MQTPQTPAGAVAFGLVSILIITPLFSRVALALPLQPPELAVGLAVFCCMPTALSSGITLTQARLGPACTGLKLGRRTAAFARERARALRQRRASAAALPRTPRN
jgi:hypothetical protein